MTGLRPHIISRALAAFVALQMFALPLFLVVSVSTVKKLQRRLLRNENTPLETLVLNSAEFAKVLFIEDDEMIFNGNLYDIKSIKKSGENYIINALADDKEEALLKITRTHENKNGKQNKHRLKIPLLFYENPIFTVYLTNTKAQHDPSSNHIFLKVLFIKIPTPPPQDLFV
jgi:hypothetical protein